MYEIQEIKDELIRKGIASEDSIVGVSQAEIDQLESKLGVVFPAMYKQYLLLLGRKAGGLFDDVNCFFGDVAGLRGEVEEMIEEEGLEFVIPETAVVFSGYQGFQYHYFISEGSEDPEVYRLMDGGEPPEKITDTFTAYLKSIIS